MAKYGTAWVAPGEQMNVTDLGIGLATNPMYIALVVTLGCFGAMFDRKADAWESDDS